MRPSLILLAVALASGAALTARASYEVTLKNVHVCCRGCVNDAADAAVNGSTVKADKASRTLTVSANSEATAQKAVDALAAAGFYGNSSDPAIKVPTTTGDDTVVKGLKVTGVHLCCNHCVSDLNKAVAKVKGVKGTTAAKDAESFEITGEFNAKEVVEALHHAGFAVQVAKE